MLADLEMYIRLVWLFVLVITILMLFICYLYLSMRRALQREQTSLAFSHMAIEGLETERRRIFRELHDTVLPLVRDREVSGLIRTICMELAPPDFSQLALKDSFSDLCDKFIKKTGIDCVCSIEDELDFAVLSAETQLHLYRIVQEAFTNIEKHSGAKKAALVARSHNSGTSEKILICVSDDGAGMQNKKGLQFNIPGRPLDKNTSGLGLRSMMQRSEIIGAKLGFVSESGNGLMVRIEIASPKGAGNAK